MHQPVMINIPQPQLLSYLPMGRKTTLNSWQTTSISSEKFIWISASSSAKACAWTVLQYVKLRSPSPSLQACSALTCHKRYYRNAGRLCDTHSFPIGTQYDIVLSHTGFPEYRLPTFLFQSLHSLHSNQNILWPLKPQRQRQTFFNSF